MNQDPFTLLGIDEEADDEAVRKAYLRRVREFPPDRAPERFQAIRAAYEHLVDARSRLAYRMFQPLSPDIPSLVADLLTPGPPGRPTVKTLLEILAESSKEYRLPVTTKVAK